MELSTSMEDQWVGGEGAMGGFWGNQGPQPHAGGALVKPSLPPSVTFQEKNTSLK
jgi:hypothetical protein